ncbi:MAG: SDR family oxidoreductase [Thermogutta sp.]
MSSRLIIGTGYLGRRIAEAWRLQGDTVFTVTRSLATAEFLALEGFRPIIADVTRPETLSRLPVVDTMVFCVGFDRKGDDSPHEIYAGGLRYVLDSPAGESGCVILISSTGVYGDHARDWIDESSPTNPLRPSAQALLKAEESLRLSAAGARSIVLRLAGIYGPGRIPLLRKLQRDTPLPGDAEAVINLIHADDAVQAVLLANQKAPKPSLFNVSDGNPVTRAVFYDELARLLNLPSPKFEDPSRPGKSKTAEGEAVGVAARGTGHKRVSSVKICSELGFSCRYPSYKQGLPTVVQEGLGGDASADRV